MKQAIVSLGFDDARSHQIRFLEEAARLGRLEVLLWTDARIRAHTGAAPKFPLAERKYFLENLRHVDAVTVAGERFGPDELPARDDPSPALWVVGEDQDTPAKRVFCKERGLGYEVIPNRIRDLIPAADPDPLPAPPGRRKVVVTGCYDWFHSGHVRFFEEVAALGAVYAVVGHDANIALLKGPHHPMYKQDERRYIVSSLRTVRQAFISTGHGWMDAAPEIARIRPDLYAVNEDGDKPEKREFCEKHGLEYVVLKRTPKEGLASRSSTDLRGF